MESPSYLNQLLNKFDFIQIIYLTDSEGCEISKACKNQTNFNDNDNDEEPQPNEKGKKLKISLHYNFNSAIDQITKTERWKTKNLLTIYDTHAIFQSKINKTSFIHFICDNKNFNYEILKEITAEIQEKLLKVEKEMESLSKEL
jgi:hypothetical protein